jgi:hypothetical protein
MGWYIKHLALCVLPNRIIYEYTKYAATPLCGINTIDSNGDPCEICITKNGSNSIVQFKYAQGTLSFKCLSSQRIPNSKN